MKHNKAREVEKWKRKSYKCGLLYRIQIHGISRNRKENVFSIDEQQDLKRWKQREKEKLFVGLEEQHSDSNISITFFYYFPHDRFWDFNHEFAFWQRLRSRWKVRRTASAGCRVLNNTLAKALSINQRPLKLNLRYGAHDLRRPFVRFNW